MKQKPPTLIPKTNKNHDKNKNKNKKGRASKKKKERASKKKERKKKRIISCLAEKTNMLSKRDDFQLFFEKKFADNS